MRFISHIYVMAVMAAAVVAPSCSNDVECVFPESSANRIDATLAYVQDILIGPSNGWLMEYFPGSAQAYGGFNVLMQFTFDGHVTVAGESFKPEESATSTYTLKQSAGAVLSFDTYNRIFHFYSDPANPNGYGSNGYGMEGDFEFLVIAASDEEVVLKGKKSGSYAIMRPMSAYYSWPEYLSAIKDAANSMSDFERMQYRSGEDVYEVRHVGKAFNIYKQSEETGEYIERHAYVLNLMGCRFYSPIKFADGDVVEGVVVNRAFGDDGALLPTNDAPGMFVPSYPDLNEFMTTKNWFFTYSQMSPWAQNKWAVTKQMFDRYGITFTYCYIGPESNILGNYYAFIFKTPASSGSIEFVYDLIGSDRISLQIGATATAYARQLYSDYGMQSMLSPLGDPDKRTFVLTADDPKNPMSIKCVDVDNAENYFTLSRERLYNPLDK